MARIALFGYWLALLTWSALPALAQSWPPPSPMTWTWAGNTYTEGQQSAFCAATAASQPGLPYCEIRPGNLCDGGPHSPASWCAVRSELGPPTYGAGIMFVAVFNGVCASGATLVPSTLECVNNTCTDNGGRTHQFNLQVNGACGGAMSSVCLLNGCQGAVVSYSSMGFTHMSNGSQACLVTGTAQVTTNPCASTDRFASSTQVAVSPTTSGGQPTPVLSAGGAGVIGNDSANLARIASNTARTAAAMEGMTGSGVGGGSGGSGSGSGNCGGIGQPACVIDEGGIEGDTAALLGSMQSDLNARIAAENAVNAAINLESLPAFGNSSERWQFNFLPFLSHSGPADCKVEADFNFLGGVVKGGFNFCPVADFVRDFLYWALMMFTALAMWNMVYGRKDPN